MKKPHAFPVPQRRIPLGRISCTGHVTVNEHRVPFESTLERDLLTLLAADQAILRVIQQPYKIPVPSGKGRAAIYIPDYIAHYGDGRRVIFEVKHREDLRKDWRTLRHRYRAAVAFASGNGMRFKILTEVEIRTPLLANLRFLSGYRHWSSGEDPVEEHLIATLEAMGPATPATLLAMAYASADNRVRAIATLWRAVSTGRISARLTMPLTMASEIWVTEGLGAEWPGPHSFELPLAFAYLRRGNADPSTWDPRPPLSMPMEDMP